MKDYLNMVLDFPKTINKMLPQNYFSEMVNNSEKSIYDWIGQVFRILAFVFLVFMLSNVIVDGFKYLTNVSNGFNESYVEDIEFVEDDEEEEMEDEGEENMIDESYYTITLLNPDATDDEDEFESRQEKIVLAEEVFGRVRYEDDFLEGLEDDETPDELIFNVGYVGDGYESDDPGALGIIANILMILLFSYAAFPLSQVISHAGNSVAKSHDNMIKFLFRDLVLVVIRAAGYILGLVLLFSAFAGVISFVFDESLFLPEIPFVETFGLILLFPLTAFAGLLGSLLDSGAILETGFVSEALSLIDTPQTFTVDGWSLDGLKTLLTMFASVLMVFVVLFVALPIWEFIIGLVTALIKWIKGPYFPHKAL